MPVQSIFRFVAFSLLLAPCTSCAQAQVGGAETIRLDFPSAGRVNGIAPGESVPKVKAIPEQPNKNPYPSFVTMEPCLYVPNDQADVSYVVADDGA